MQGLPPNLHSAWSHGHPVGIECTAATCRHRALLPLDTIGARAGNMKYIRDLRLRCTKCGGREFNVALFVRMGEPEAWLADQQKPAEF
jgi:hypothetical protein